MARADRGDTLREIVIRQYLAEARSWSSPTWNWGGGVVRELLHEPRLAWPFLLELIDRAPAEVLAEIAAGPLEDFLAMHGRHVIGWVESEAARNARLRVTLAGVWQNRMSTTTWDRVQALVRPEDRALFERDELPWQERLLTAEVAGVPPLRAGDRDDASVASRTRLLDAALEAKRDGPTPWNTPVRLELEVATVHPLAASLADIVHAVVETLASDRPTGLTDTAHAGRAVITTADLVRGVDARSRRARQDGYRLELFRMYEDEIAALDDARDPEEIADVLTAEELAEGLDGEDWYERLLERFERERGDPAT